MSKAATVAMLLGAIIVCSRGPLLLAPAATLRWFRQAISTEARTRILGAVVILLAGLMIWSGISEDSTLAAILLIFGVFFLVMVVPMLVLFPRTYMGLAEFVLPADPDENLFGWRLIGLVGVVIGVVLFRYGLVAL